MLLHIPPFTAQLKYGNNLCHKRRPIANDDHHPNKFTIDSLLYSKLENETLLAIVSKVYYSSSSVDAIQNVFIFVDVQSILSLLVETATQCLWCLHYGLYDDLGESSSSNNTQLFFLTNRTFSVPSRAKPIKCTGKPSIATATSACLSRSYSCLRRCSGQSGAIILEDVDGAGAQVLHHQVHVLPRAQAAGDLREDEAPAVGALQVEAHPHAVRAVRPLVLGVLDEVAAPLAAALPVGLQGRAVQRRHLSICL
mmetsp:Transcript_24366/g.33716  ORF Transcript_24366/g.33716 Transcript_24366/m.33716 type:complete len:253 (+) Transcript_24366:60-818(+)